MDSIRKSICEFTAVEHRIEYVTEKNGVAYYNDSKGTNPDAAIKGIQAMNRPTLLIGGGYDKESSYDEWIQAFDGKVRYLVLIGQTKEKIKAAGYPREISGQAVYEDICDQIEGKENGSYVLLSKFEDDVIFEYHITIMDHEFNLGILTMRLPEGIYAANFDE